MLVGSFNVVALATAASLAAAPAAAGPPPASAAPSTPPPPTAPPATAPPTEAAPTAAPPTAAPPTAAPPTAAPPTAAPPTAAPPTAAPPSTTPPPGPPPSSTPPAPVDDGGWGIEDQAPPQTGAPGEATTATSTGYQPPTPPPPELLAKNRRLSAQMQRGERWLIGGRIGAPLSLIPTLIGVGMLVAHGAQQRAYAYDDEYERPPPRGLLVGGVAFTVIGLGALGTSIWAAVHGFRLMQTARAGQFALSAGPNHAGLSFRTRF